MTDNDRIKGLMEANIKLISEKEELEAENAKLSLLLEKEGKFPRKEINMYMEGNKDGYDCAKEELKNLSEIKDELHKKVEKLESSRRWLAEQLINKDFWNHKGWIGKETTFHYPNDDITKKTDGYKHLYKTKEEAIQSWIKASENGK